MNTRGHTSSVVLDLTASVGTQSDLYMFTVACKRLVDRVVHYLADEVVKSLYRGGADIHTRSFTYRLKSLEYLYLTVVVRLPDHFVSFFFQTVFIPFEVSYLLRMLSVDRPLI